MKVTVEIDCTPEEARRAMGLPDVTTMQDAYVARLSEMSEGGFKPEAIEALVKGWAPLGEVGMGMWRSLMEAAANRTKEPPR